MVMVIFCTAAFDFFFYITVSSLSYSLMSNPVQLQNYRSGIMFCIQFVECDNAIDLCLPSFSSSCSFLFSEFVPLLPINSI